jgi:hypothetical protein
LRQHLGVAAARIEHELLELGIGADLVRAQHTHFVPLCFECGEDALAQVVRKLPALLDLLLGLHDLLLDQHRLRRQERDRARSRRAGLELRRRMHGSLGRDRTAGQQANRAGAS